MCTCTTFCWSNVYAHNYYFALFLAVRTFFTTFAKTKHFTSMRVLIINTSEKTGGAAVASNRLMNALNNNGVKARMLVRDKETDEITVSPVGHPWLAQWAFLWERLCIFFHLHFSRKHLFEIDIANAGIDVTHTRYFKEADVIHLEWINQGMLSLNGIRRILDSGKPVVWTMHDLWPATAICHYARGCKSYQSSCHNCPLLPGRSDNDLSAKVWRKKRKIIHNRTIHFVTCSKWLQRQAEVSGLFHHQTVTAIPNPINTHVFHPDNKEQARRRLGLPVDKRIILFVSQKVTDERKGMAYFVEAVSKLADSDPTAKSTTVLAILGGHGEEIAGRLALPAFPLGYVSDDRKIVDVYNSADVFVLPSLEDNLPNTIMEAMACGVPCVGFNVGGIPEMITNGITGYVAKERDADDLAKGIVWALDPSRSKSLSEQSVSKVQLEYSEHAVAMKYIDVYTDALAQKGYNI